MIFLDSPGVGTFWLNQIQTEKSKNLKNFKNNKEKLKQNLKDKILGCCFVYWFLKVKKKKKGNFF